MRIADGSGTDKYLRFGHRRAKAAKATDDCVLHWKYPGRPILLNLSFLLSHLRAYIAHLDVDILRFPGHQT